MIGAQTLFVRIAAVLETSARPVSVPSNGHGNDPATALSMPAPVKHTQDRQTPEDQISASPRMETVKEKRISSPNHCGKFVPQRLLQSKKQNPSLRLPKVSLTS